MTLKNSMEQKQLDYNQPFLSARRFGVSSDVEISKKADNFPTLPFYKSELKSGPIRKAGTVPFVWEKSPGRPKDENKSQLESLGRPPIAPKLPPGRILNAQQQTSDKVNADQAITRTPSGSPHFDSKNPSHSDESSKFDYFIKEAEENQSFYSDNDDESYMDAQDSLSRSESVFLNCSISGVSGLDGLDVKQSGTFSTDPHTWDYMMDRFLPAAKSIASEAPQYTSRKPPVSWEHPAQTKNFATVDKNPPVYRSKPNYMSYYNQNSAEEESEYEDSEYGDQENMSGKVCGLLPRFCLKNSFFVMNPVPGMRVGSHIPASSVRTVRAKSSDPGAHVQTKKESHQKTELSTNLKGVSNWFPTSCQISSKNPDGSSLYKRLQAGGTSPYRHGVSRSPSHEDKNGRNSFEELLGRHESTNLESGSESPMVEKTLYIDSVHILASPNSDSDKKGLNGSTGGIDSDYPDKSWDMKEFSPIEDMKRYTIADVNVDKNKGMKEDQYHMKDSSCLQGSKMPDNSKMDWGNYCPTKNENNKDRTGSLSQFPLAPPLPKSPTESWLGRTLPSVSSRNQSSRSFLSMHAKETNVKTSKGHLQLSKDLLTPIPEC